MAAPEQQVIPPPPQLPAHIPTADEENALLIEHINADGAVMVRNGDVQVVIACLGVLPVGTTGN